MASKQQLWKELWRDTTEILREFHGSPQKIFQKVFKQRGLIKRYQELSDMESHITTSLLGGCRVNGERASYPVEVMLQGKIVKVWKLTETLTGVELKQVRKSYRRGGRDQLALSNRITRRITKQTGEQLALFDITLLDDGLKALPS